MSLIEVVTGCKHHPDCSTCPFEDCIADDGDLGDDEADGAALTVRERCLVLAELHPDWSRQGIANEVGVSRERVRQILGNAGKHQKGPFFRICNTCGNRKRVLKASEAEAKQCKHCRLSYLRRVARGFR